MERLTRRQRREKQRAEQKKLNKKVRQQGLTRTESKLLIAPAVTKEQKKTQKKIEKKYNYKYLRSLGYTPDEAKRFQGASKETIKQLEKTLATPLKKEQIERNKKAAEKAAKRKKEAAKDYFTIYWEDLIGHADQDEVDDQRRLFRFMTVPALEETMVDLLQVQAGITQASRTYIDTPTNLYETRSYYRRRGIVKIYEGTATSYRQILIAVNTLMVIIYDLTVKQGVLDEVIESLRAFNPKMGNRLYRATLKESKGLWGFE